MSPPRGGFHFLNWKEIGFPRLSLVSMLHLDRAHHPFLCCSEMREMGQLTSQAGSVLMLHESASACSHSETPGFLGHDKGRLARQREAQRHFPSCHKAENNS